MPNQANYLQSSLSVAQKEELLEVLARQSGGSVAYSKSGLSTAFSFPNGHRFQFRGHEDVISIARNMNINITTLDPALTKLDGIAEVILQEKVYNALSNVFSAKNLKSMNLKSLSNMASERIFSENIFPRHMADMEEMFSIILSGDGFKQLASKYIDDNYGLDFAADVLVEANKLGMQFYNSQLIPRVNADPERDTKNSDGLIGNDVSEKIEAWILGRITSSVEKDTPVKAVIKGIHRTLNGRNVSIGLVGDEGFVKSDVMNSFVAKVIMDAVSLEKKGDDPKGVVEKLSFFDGRANRFLSKPGDSANSGLMVSQSIENSLKLLGARGRLKNVSDDDFDSLKEKMRELDNAVKNNSQDQIVQISAVNAQVSLLEGVANDISPNMIVGQRVIDDILNATSMKFVAGKSVNESFEATRNIEMHVKNAKESVDTSLEIAKKYMPTIASEVNSEWNTLFYKGNSVPYGVDPEDVLSRLENLTEGIPRKVYDYGKELILDNYPVVRDTMAYFSKENASWKTVISLSEETPAFPRNEKSETQWEVANQVVLAGGLVDTFFKELHPRIKKEMGNNLSHKNVPPAIVEGVPVQPERKNKTIVKPDVVTQPEVEKKFESKDSSLVDLDVEPKQVDEEKVVVPVAKNETLDVEPEKVAVSISGKIYQDIEDTFDRITRFSLKDDDSLMMDEYSWISDQWDKIVSSGQPGTEDMLDELQYRFAYIIKHPSQSNIKNWYMQDMQRSDVGDRITSLLESIKNSAKNNSFPGLEKVVSNLTQSLFDRQGRPHINVKESVFDDVTESLFDLSNRMDSGDLGDLSKIVEQLDKRNSLYVKFTDLGDQNPENKEDIIKLFNSMVNIRDVDTLSLSNVNANLSELLLGGLDEVVANARNVEPSEASYTLYEEQDMILVGSYDETYKNMIPTPKVKDVSPKVDRDDEPSMSPSMM